MKNEPTKISPDLTIPGFDVTVHSPHSCQVKSQDGRYEFSAKIEEKNENIIISCPRFPMPLTLRAGAWSSINCQFTTDVDDAITQMANLLRLMDEFSRDGFSAKIERNKLFLSHASKPDYSLRVWPADARKIVSFTDKLLYTLVEYCGPAYDAKANTKWKYEGWDINNSRFIAIDKNFEKFCQELKTRVLNLGEEKDPRIAEWVSEEIENKLAPQGVIFTPRPEKATVDFFHPVGLSGSLSFALFTSNFGYDFNQKFPNPNFPTDIEQEKVVLFSCDRPNYRSPYAKALLAKKPQQVIEEIRGFLAIALVHQEVCHEWKSDLLVPKLRHSKMLLVNTELDGNKSIILELNRERGRLVLRGMGEELYYPIWDIPTVVDTKEITQTIVKLAEKHIQEFIQNAEYDPPKGSFPEIDF
jgi:hypothetical protein